MSHHPHANRAGTLDIVGIGVSVWDRILTLDRYPDEGAVVRAKAAVSGLGGGVAVATGTAALLGCSCGLLDSLGMDEAGELIIRRLESLGVDLSLIERHPNLSSSTASIWTSLASQERTIVYVPGTASDVLRWTPSIEKTLRRAAIIHTNGRHPSIWKRAIEMARVGDARLSFDGGAHRFREALVPLIKASDIVVVARQFAEAFLTSLVTAVSKPSQDVNGEAADGDAAQLVRLMRRELRADIVGVTDGVNGSFFIDAAETFHHQPAVEVDRAVDTTGCGDTFHGAFLSGFIHQFTLQESAALASEVASRNARAAGAISIDRASVSDLRASHR